MGTAKRTMGILLYSNWELGAVEKWTPQRVLKFKSPVVCMHTEYNSLMIVLAEPGANEMRLRGVTTYIKLR